jgi:hypothetical protein
LKNIRSEIQLWVQAIAFVVAWVVVLRATKTPFEINAEALKCLPEAVTVYAIFHLAFVGWLWKFPLFRCWLVPLPNLTGSWKGTLKSTWHGAVGSNPVTRDITLVIRQRFSSISCVLYTAESMSVSDAAVLTDGGETGVPLLSYNYQNTPRVSLRQRSNVHLGAVVLRFETSSGEWFLRGEYWTNRQTAGEMELKFVSRKAEAPQLPTSSTGNQSRTAK